MGDVSFGAGVSFPQFFFSDMEIAFEVLNDNILEDTEVGEITIVPDPTNFDGHAPLFKSVRIIIRDDEGKINKLRIDRYKFIACSGYIIILPAAALVTLEAPSVAHEAEFQFNVSVLLVRPEVSQASLEINLMDTEITALNPG